MTKQYAKPNDVIKSKITGEVFRVIKSLDRSAVYEKCGRFWNIRHSDYEVVGEHFGQA